ncbi:MAG: hypothetical protein JWM32_1050 [Verrucomicrobia bacterium]|nr:hypothetical protein [Verrucomicrobiota bacterium]
MTRFILKMKSNFALLPIFIFGAALSLVGRASDASAAAKPAHSYAPLPFKPLGNHGQALVDMEMEKHPELKLIAVHVTLPGVPADAATGRYMMFSSIGLVGKPDGANDLALFQTKKEKTRLSKDVPPGTLLYRPTSQPKYAVLTPLLNSAGEAIGLMGIVFPYAEGDDTKKYDEIAHAVRDDFMHRIAAKDDLFKAAE